MDIRPAIEYLIDTYDPLSILVYGSAVSGDADAASDLDVVLIVREKTKGEDRSVIGGIPLDCLILTQEQAENAETLTFLYHSVILKDDGTGRRLKERVCAFVEENRVTSREDKEEIRRGLSRMRQRMEKRDDLGNFTAAALVWESLCDYMLLRDLFYFGEKKTLSYIRENDPKGYALLQEALLMRTNRAIGEWMDHVTGGNHV